MSKNKPKVLLDLRWFSPGNTGGIEQVARNFLNQSEKLSKSNEYYLLTQRNSKKIIENLLSRNGTVVLVNSLPMLVRRLIGEVFRRFNTDLLQNWQNFSRMIDQKITEISPDLVVSFIGYIDPHCYQYKNLLIVPDLLHEDHPEFFSEKGLISRQRNYTTSMQTADRILTISQFSKNSILEKYPDLEPKVKVAYLAPSMNYTSQPVPESGFQERVLNKYNLTGKRYLLYPANTWPHKNHTILVEALDILINDLHEPFIVVLTGSPKRAQESLIAKINHHRLKGYVFFTGYISPEELRVLYYHASSLVFPSLYEGFGLPLLEAMWCNCPIICSSVGSIPEVAGEAGYYFNTGSARSLADTILRLESDNSLRKKYIQAGIFQREQFHTEEFGNLIFETISEILE